MAACENCGKSGFDRRQMEIDSVRRLIIGPCCAQKALQSPDVQSDIEYGLHISSKTGVTAYLQGAGLSVMFNKSPEEIRELISEFKAA